MITKPALESSASATASSCPATAESIKACNEWISEDSAVIGYIKMKCTKSVVAGMNASDNTSKKVWDTLKAKFDRASVAIVLEEIHKAFSFRLSGVDPTGEISQLAIMFRQLADHRFSIPKFICASILLMVILPRWDSLSTFLLQLNALDKLDWDIVSKGIIGEYSRLKSSSQAGPSMNKISAVKWKSDHLPSWKGKAKGEQPAASSSGSGSQKRKHFKSCARKQVKEHCEAAKQHDHTHMAEMAMVVDPPAPAASTSALPAPPPVPTPLLIITMVNSNGRIITAPAFIPKALLAAIAAKPIPCRYTGSKEVWPSI